VLRFQDDGIAEGREIFMEGLNQPFGMALLGDTFYVGNTDGVVAFPYAAGADRITVPGRKLTAFKPGGHWTRSRHRCRRSHGGNEVAEAFD
jgi:glucose/arabinose dehydrogenase